MLQGSTCFGAMERSESTAWNSLVDRSFGEDWLVNLENLESFFGSRVLLAWEKMLKCCKKRKVSNTFQHFPILHLFQQCQTGRCHGSCLPGYGQLTQAYKIPHIDPRLAGLQYPRGLGTVDFDRSIQDDKGWLGPGAAAQGRLPCVCFFGIFWGFYRLDGVDWCKRTDVCCCRNGRLWRTVVSSEKQKIVFADFSLFNPTMFSRLIHFHIVRSNSVCEQQQQNLCLMISPLEEQWLGHQ